MSCVWNQRHHKHSSPLNHNSQTQNHHFSNITSDELNAFFLKAGRRLQNRISHVSRGISNATHDRWCFPMPLHFKAWIHKPRRVQHHIGFTDKAGCLTVQSVQVFTSSVWKLIQSTISDGKLVKVLATTRLMERDGCLGEKANTVVCLSRESRQHSTIFKLVEYF